MISIIGASNIDICAKSDKKIILEDSNIGRVSYHVGGVGRNIAHNLALMKKQVNFFSIFADDLSSNKIFDNLNSLKINYSNSLFLKNANTPVYLFIADNDGSMICAVNDMSLLKELTPSFLKDKIDIINKSNLCIIDANLEEDSIDFLLNECKIPVLCDPVSIKKGERFLKNLDKIHTFKPNLLEALYFTKKKRVEDAGKYLINKGLKRVFISMGKDGLYYQDSRESGYIKVNKIIAKNATGAGDALSAALAYSLDEGWSIKESALFAVSAAQIAINSEDVVNDELNIRKIEEVMMEIKKLN